MYGSGTTFNSDEGFMQGSFHTVEDKVRPPDFETKALKERYDFFEKLIRKNKLDEQGKVFHAQLPLTKFKADVPCADVRHLAT